MDFAKARRVLNWSEYLDQHRAMIYARELTVEQLRDQFILEAEELLAAHHQELKEHNAWQRAQYY